MPSASRPVIARDFYKLHRFPALNSADFRWDITREEYERPGKITREVFAELAGDNLKILDPLPSFHTPTNRLQLFDTRSFYRDEDHLTRHGVDHHLGDMLRKMISQISEKKQPIESAEGKK